MPTNRHRRTRGRTVLTLDSLGLGELVRWGLGRAVVGAYVPLYRLEEPPVPVRVWTDWAELFETYEQFREGYLARTAERFPEQVPGIELQYRAWLQGDDPRTAVPERPDPRRLLGMTA